MRTLPFHREGLVIREDVKQEREKRQRLRAILSCQIAADILRRRPGLTQETQRHSLDEK